MLFGSKIPCVKVLNHHDEICADVPEFGGAMPAIFQMEVNFHALIAAFRSGTGIVDSFPFLAVPGRRVIETGVTVKRNAACSAVLRFGAGRRTGAGCTVHQRAAELGILAV